ncbi:MAG: hypothetical protein ACTS4Y_00960, partial [Candidatus Hodgkinia cicadicola]
GGYKLKLIRTELVKLVNEIDEELFIKLQRRLFLILTDNWSLNVRTNELTSQGNFRGNNL